MKNVKEVYVSVDVTGINESRTRNDVAIDAIDGINKMSISTVDVKVDIEKAETKTISNIPISAVNNTENFKVVFSNGEEVASVDVTAAPSVLEKISTSDFSATIDVEELQEGERRVFVTISSTNYLLDYVLISKEKLIITLER